MTELEREIAASIIEALSLELPVDEFDPEAPLLQAIAQDPMLRELKLIAEPWDVGPGGYRLGAFPAEWGEWNDRYLDLVHARRWWQLAAVAELALVGLLGGGLVALSLQHKTVAYVVEVDALGAAVSLKPVEGAGRPTDERIVRYQLAAIVRGARTVMTDRAAMKRTLDQVYAYAPV